MADVMKLVEEIKTLTLLEVNDLVKALEEEFGVSAAAPVMVAGAAPAGEAAAEKTDFDVELTDVGPNKVKVIKVVREVTGLGLKEAKEVVDGAPKMLKEGAEKAEAEDIKAKLEAEGAKVTLKQCNGHRAREIFSRAFFVKKSIDSDLTFVVEWTVHYCGVLCDKVYAKI